MSGASTHATVIASCSGALPHTPLFRQYAPVYDTHLRRGRRGREGGVRGAEEGSGGASRLLRFGCC